MLYRKIEAAYMICRRCSGPLVVGSGAIRIPRTTSTAPANVAEVPMIANTTSLCSTMRVCFSVDRPRLEQTLDLDHVNEPPPVARALPAFQLAFLEPLLKKPPADLRDPGGVVERPQRRHRRGIYNGRAQILSGDA